MWAGTAGGPGTGVTQVDAVVVGSGPNGLAAAVTLARAGLEVHVVEGATTPGGGCRTEELTLPGFRHDVCSAAHPLLALSPFFADPAFDALRGRLVRPEVPFAHPLDDGRAAAALPSVDATADALGVDSRAYRRLLAPLVDEVAALAAGVLAPVRRPTRHPLVLARFGAVGVRSLDHLAGRFATPEARALLAGAAGHAVRPLSAPVTAGFALLLTAAAHAVGWPVVTGGSAAVTDALVDELARLGGTLEVGRWVGSLDELPRATAVLLDVAPAALPDLVGGALPDGYRRALGRFRPAPGVCKVDWALSGPVPWANPEIGRAATVHLGGTVAEIAASEAEVLAGRVPARPFVIFVQATVADPSRAPAGRHTGWAYCHVPHGSTVDCTDAIEAQVERFAPGFRDTILARHTVHAAGMEAYDANYVGGDINGGAGTLRQVFTRPAVSPRPWVTPVPHTYLCSSATPPGGGVHGMCGWHAARAALRRDG